VYICTGKETVLKRVFYKLFFFVCFLRTIRTVLILKEERKKRPLRGCMYYKLENGNFRAV